MPMIQTYKYAKENKKLCGATGARFLSSRILILKNSACSSHEQHEKQQDQLPSTLVNGQSLDGGDFMWFLTQI